MTDRTKSAGGFVFREMPKLEPGSDQSEGEEQTLWVEIRPKDDHLRFPDEDDYVSGQPFGEIVEFATTGIARHVIMKSGLLSLHAINLGYPESDTGYSARQLDLIGDDDWFGECWQVLNAHGWHGGHQLASKELIDRVIGVVGQEIIDDARSKYGSEWHCLVLEIAAAHFVRPLTRLWYAANLMSLHYIHHDDIRFGYLWAEYNVRLRHEADASRGLKTRKSASRGGQARTSAFKTNRSRVLSEIQRLVEFGHSVSRAAELAYKNGLGASASANRKLYYRARKKS